MFIHLFNIHSIWLLTFFFVFIESILLLFLNLLVVRTHKKKKNNPLQYSMLHLENENENHILVWSRPVTEHPPTQQLSIHESKRDKESHTFPFLQDSNEFILHQPLHAGLDGAPVGLGLRPPLRAPVRGAPLPSGAGGQQRAGGIRPHILWCAGHASNDDLYIGGGGEQGTELWMW